MKNKPKQERVTNPVRSAASGIGADPLGQIVLVEPEIPNNTGSIARTCVGFGLGLHLVHPLGFDIDEKACRRAGLDYWPRVRLTEHADVHAYQSTMRSAPSFWLFSARASRSLLDVEFSPGDHLVFGRESAGLPEAMTSVHPDRCVSIPLAPGERSLNVSNAAAIVAFEFVRSMVGRGLAGLDSEGRLCNSSMI